MAKNDEYFNMFERMVNEIGKAYKDANILTAIQRIQEEHKIDNHHPAYGILAHIIELAKADLGLSVYKLYFDNSRNSQCTIQHFNKLSHDKGSQKRIKIKLPNAKVLEKPLSGLRHSLLAHLDKTPSLSSVQTPDLIQALTEITKLLNSIADKNIDDRIYSISIMKLSFSELNDTIGLLELLKPLIIKEEKSNG